MPGIVAWVLVHGSYGVVLALLLCGGFGLPVPEDGILLASGALVATGTMAWLPTLLVCMLGVLGADSIMYLVGRRLGPHALKRLSPARRERVERLFARHGLKLVPAARFITLLRFPVFMLSGAHRLPFRRFVAYDALGLVGSSTLMLGLGYAFARRLPTLLAWLSEFRNYALAGFGALVAATLAVALLRARRARTTPVPPGPALLPAPVSSRTPSLAPPAQ